MKLFKFITAAIVVFLIIVAAAYMADKELDKQFNSGIELVW